MKKIIVFFLFILATFVSHAQCSTVSVQISSSDTTSIQLYNAGIFNIPSGFANVCEWEVVDFSGEIIFQETTSGDFEDQSFALFNHSVPITDSMKATIVITNEVEGIICTMTDTLFWKETEVIPGAFIGNWSVLSNNGGVSEDITSTGTINNLLMEIYPSPAQDYFSINGEQETYDFQIINLNGQIIKSYFDFSKSKKVDISNFPNGVYFVQFVDEKNKVMHKLIKR